MCNALDHLGQLLLLEKIVVLCLVLVDGVIFLSCILKAENACISTVASGKRHICVLL